MTILSPLGEMVRRVDPDHYLTALFAPDSARETLFLLFAFNHELARARIVASEPGIALIRLQWWREVVEGTPKRHEVASPLADALAKGLLPREDLLAMIDGREAETEEAIETLLDWRIYLRATAGRLAVVAGKVLRATPNELPVLEACGTAYGAVDVLRRTALLARQNRCLWPRDILLQHGFDIPDVLENPWAAKLAPARQILQQEASALLARAGRTRRDIRAAMLPAVLARRDLSRLGAPITARGLGDRIALWWAA